MAADLAEDEIQTAPAAAAQHIDDIRASSGRMRRLADQLITVNALESGQQILKMEWLDVGPLLLTVLDSVRARIRVKSIRLETSIPSGPILAKADAHAFERIMENLISNSIKFSPVGTIVQVRVEDQKGRWAFRVIDSGPGFTDEDFRHIF
jgi:signal transduction histidine kinase